MSRRCVLLAAVLAAACSARLCLAVEGGIRALDTVKVTAGPAPVRLGDATVATLRAGTVLVADEVDGPWVGVSLEKDGQTIRGWVHERHLSRATAPPKDVGSAPPEKPQATVPELPEEPAGPGERRPTVASLSVQPVQVRISRLDGKESVRTVVPGCWISIDEQTPFCYWAGRELRFEWRGPLLYVAENGGQARLAGFDVARCRKADAPAVRRALLGQATADKRAPLAFWLNGDALDDLEWLRPLCADRAVALVVSDPPGGDLGPLARLPEAAAVCLDRCAEVSDLGPLAGLTRLRSLALIRCPEVSDLAPLAKLPRLEALRLHGRSKVADLGPLAGLRSLRSLYVYQGNGIQDLAPLAGLTELVSLDLIACGGVADLAPLGKLASLRTLTLGPCPNVAGLAPLGELTHLTSLRLLGDDWDRLTDLAPLGKLTRLSQLHLIACERVVDIGPLARLTSLATLELPKCSRVSDLAPLSGLSGLVSLDLSDCVGVSDLAPLAKLPRLASVDLRRCRKDLDITPLRDVAVRGGTILVDKAEEPTEPKIP